MANKSQFQIVEQGKIFDLVEAGEQGFLDMLNVVSGTSTLDQRIGDMNKSV